MAAPLLGAIVGGASSIIGGILGNNSQEKANELNAMMQYKAMTKGIQYRVADANKAGVHPLFALGAQTYNWQPSAVGSTALGEGIANAGQQIGRAIDAGGSAGDRAANAALMKLQIERAGLENILLAKQVSGQGQPMAPAAPAVGDRHLIPGQRQTLVHAPSQAPTSDLVVSQPNQVIVADPNSIGGSADPGTVNDLGFIKTRNGQIAVPGSDTKQLLEDSPYEWDHWVRNSLLPRVGYDIKNAPRPTDSPGPNHHWELSTITGEWLPVRNNYDPDAWKNYK